MVYLLAIRSLGTVKQTHFVTSSNFVHLLLVDCIRTIKCGVLNSLYLHDVVGARLIKLVADSFVLLSILRRVQLVDINRLFSPSLWIGWLRSPFNWNICRYPEYKDVNIKIKKDRTSVRPVSGRS